MEHESLPPGWRPPDEEGQRLLHLLRATSPELVASAASTPETTIWLPWYTRIECQFAQDGTDLAVRPYLSEQKYHDAPLVERDVIEVYGLAALPDAGRGVRLSGQDLSAFREPPVPGSRSRSLARRCDARLAAGG